ncbi:lysozyme family protein, partial [Hominisplanchenecus sp.]|uniref:lysozyme family protein n=1 Tax=Hominisplanchenecus sp. TaxID=3038130 RepID=UPI003995FF0F
MKEIKEKVRGQSPKIRNPASRLPKELVRSAMLEAKEKSSIMADKIGRETGEESPVEYAGNRIQRVEQRMGRESASAAYRGGKKLAVKTYEKIKAQKQKQREAATPPLGEENTRGNTFTQAGQTMAKKGRTEATRSIKVKPEAEKTIKEAGNRTVKIAPRVVKASPVSSQKVKTQAVLQKKQALKSMKAAREAKRAAMHSVQTAKQSAKATGRGLKAMAEAAAHAVKAAFAALMAGGGAVLVVLILIVGIIGGAAFLGNSQSSEALSAEVLAHTPAIQKYASEFGIPEYVPAIQAIMMQESGGRGTDPMQASECPYNTQYPNTPGAIQDA